MKTLFANNENDFFASFETLTKEELSEVKGGISRDLDTFIDDLD